MSTIPEPKEPRSQSVARAEVTLPASLLCSIAIHAVFIGLLLGLSTSPVVGVVLPLLLGAGVAIGALRLIIGNAEPSYSEHLTGLVRLLEPLVRGWVPVVWLVLVILSLFVGMWLRGIELHDTNMQAADPCSIHSLMDSVLASDSTQSSNVNYAFAVVLAAELETLQPNDDQRRRLARNLLTLSTNELIQLSDLVVKSSTAELLGGSESTVFEVFGNYGDPKADR